MVDKSSYPQERQTMGKLDSSESMLLNYLMSVLEQCWRSGSPAAGQSAEDWKLMSQCIIRRVRSFETRRVVPEDRRSQVRDVAKGLVQTFESSPKLIGPLIADYEFVAEQALIALDNFKHPND